MTAGGAHHPKVPYHPPPSIAHEIYVAIGFLVTMALAMFSFALWWRWQQKREDIKEVERRRELSRRGFPATEKYYAEEEEEEKEEQVESRASGDGAKGDVVVGDGKGTNEAVRDGEDDGEEFKRVEESRGQIEGSGEGRKVVHV
jgi:hypothetical protein